MQKSEQSKTTLLNFIKSNMSEDEFNKEQDEMFAEDDKERFESYEEFIEHNRKCLKKETNNKIDFLKTLKEKIENGKISLIDKEDVTYHELAKYFYYNKETRLVLTGKHDDVKQITEVDSNFLYELESLISDNQITMSMGAPFSEWDPEECMSDAKGNILISHPR